MCEICKFHVALLAQWRITEWEKGIVYKNSLNAKILTRNVNGWKISSIQIVQSYGDGFDD